MFMWLAMGLTAVAKPSVVPNQVQGKYGYQMRQVTSGSFRMGSPSIQSLRSNDEDLHKVTISRSFYIGTKEVSIQLWKFVTDEDPTKRSGRECFRTGEPVATTASYPVYCVDFYEVVRFANTLSK